MRLIDADELKKAIDKEFEKADLTDYEACSCVCEIYDKCIDNAPTVAVDEEIERQREELYQSCKKLFDTARMLGVERPQGEWVCTFHSSFPQYESSEYRCSICNGVGGKLDKFCPNCGAQMKGELK